MKISLNNFVSILALCLVFLTSCDRFFGHSLEDSCPDNQSTVINTEQSDTAKTESLAEVAISKTNELDNKLNCLSDSIINLYNRIKDLENKNSLMIDKTSAYTFMIAEFVILAIIMLILYRQIKSQERTISSFQISTLSENTVRSIVETNIKDIVGQINNIISNQNRSISALTTKLNSLEANRNAFVPPFQPLNSEMTVTKKKDEPSHARGNVFYMPRTMTHMQFDDSRKKYVKDDTVCFTFTLKANGKASFIFEPYDESSVRRAFDSREETLLTVCDLEIKNPSGKSFENVEPGEAELNGSIWQVTKKLKLRYV